MRLKLVLVGCIFGMQLNVVATNGNGTNNNEDNVDTVAVKYASTIEANDLSKHLHILASDEYEGRETTKKGQKMAAKYISEYFAGLGLPKVVNNDSYYQEFPLKVNKTEGELTFDGKEFNMFEDYFFYAGFQSDTLIEGSSIVFAGYGIDADKYTDYKDLDVKGKVVLVLDGEPFHKNGKSFVSESREGSNWNWRKKLVTAKQKGAKALLVVSSDFSERLERLKILFQMPNMRLWKEEDETSKGKKKRSNRVTNFYVSPDVANQMMSKSGQTVDGIIAAIGKKGRSVSFNIEGEVKVGVKKTAEKVYSENVLGYVEGSDLKEELVVITAHYDHIGKQGDVINNGADDDGSGTVAVLELAEAFVKAKADGFGPRRSMLFMTVSGEEKGLLGSEYYVNHPVFPLENTVADLNVDMIGRVDSAHMDNPDYVYLIGSDKLSSELHEISEEANKTYTGLELDYTYNSPDDPNRYYYRSDHYNFAKNNIPVIFYFNGTHPDYHAPTDTVEKINFEKMEKITRMVFHTAWKLANRDEKIKVDVDNDFDE